MLQHWSRNSYVLRARERERRVGAPLSKCPRHTHPAHTSRRVINIQSVSLLLLLFQFLRLSYDTSLPALVVCFIYFSLSSCWFYRDRVKVFAMRHSKMRENTTTMEMNSSDFGCRVPTTRAAASRLLFLPPASYLCDFCFQVVLSWVGSYSFFFEHTRERQTAKYDAKQGEECLPNATLLQRVLRLCLKRLKHYVNATSLSFANGANNNSLFFVLLTHNS